MDARKNLDLVVDFYVCASQLVPPVEITFQQVNSRFSNECGLLLRQPDAAFKSDGGVQLVAGVVVGAFGLGRQVERIRELYAHQFYSLCDSIQYLVTQNNKAVQFLIKTRMIQVLKRQASSFKFCNSTQSQKPLVDYKQRGQYRVPLQLSIGEVIQDFEVRHRKKYTDFEIDYVGLKCKKHQVQWHHFDCEEETNSMGFMIKCQQAPQIVKLTMQKLLQCGSKNYPVRNPIEHMTRRSFSPENFGFVTPDYLFFGYQTPSITDHKNLMDVFMDMMFNPLFREEDFKELIWRYSYRHGIGLEITGDLSSEVDNMWYLNETRIYDVIDRHLLQGKGMNVKKELLGFTYLDALSWYRKIFQPKNLVMLSHGDLHPIKVAESYRKVIQKFDWDNQHSPKPGKTAAEIPKQEVRVKREREVDEGNKSKTLKIEQIENAIPLILSFKLDDLSVEEKVLLPILSYILFDMPEAPFMAWNTLDTPYPRHYGYQSTHFNIGITLKPQKQAGISESQLLENEKALREQLSNLIEKGIPNQVIEQCLLHLEGEYYSSNGMKIITACLDQLAEAPSFEDITPIESTLNVKKFISKVLRNYRKHNTFQKLLQKFIVNNPHYVRIWGKTNPHLIDDAQFYEKSQLRRLLEKLEREDVPALEEIKGFVPPTLLQDYRVLPKIQVSQFEIFEEKSPQHLSINSVKVSHNHKCDGIRLVFKFDITDIEQDQIRLLPILAEALPWMGPKGIKLDAYKAYLAMYIKDISVRHEAVRTASGMKIYLFVQAEFTDRNAEYGFNICTGLLHDFNIRNIESLSQRVQKKASQTYNQISQNLIQVHGRHIASTQSPYAMMEDILFMSRATCSLASDILKTTNPKDQLYSTAHQLSKIIQKLADKNRLQLLIECRRESLPRYEKYLQMMLNPLKPSQTIIESINDKGFEPSPCLKYFPNYDNEYIFEAFAVPYFDNLKQVPASLVLSSVINQNIRLYNSGGGCFLFKGSMVTYLTGSRKKYVELEGYYKKIEDIDQAKRFIFQKFKRYTAADEFYTGTSAEQARHFKQAVAMVTQESVEAVLQKYILNAVKEQKSSMLALGPHLSNYEPLLKKGWTVERVVEEMSREMQSKSRVQAQIEMSKYINLY